MSLSFTITAAPRRSRPIVWYALTMLLIAAMAASMVRAEAPTVVRLARVEGAPQIVDLFVGQSTTLRTEWKVKRVSVSNPDIADIEVLTPTQVLVVGKAVGTTDIVIWSEEEEAWQSRVVVTSDLSTLQTSLSRLFAGSQITLEQLGDTLIVKGRLRRTEHTAQLHRLLDQTGRDYVDMTSVAGVQQVLLRVRIAEASRRQIRNLGVNFFKADDEAIVGSTIGASGSGPLNPINAGVPEGAPVGSDLPFEFLDDVNVSSAVTLFTGIPASDFSAFIQALAENQYLRILAEPNLVALSGERASFLAGGEFPIPIVQGGTGESTAITIEYREFGVRLNFKPVVLGDGTIHLHVAPEVSELSDVGAVEIEGFRVPALLTRRAETTIEMNSGQTFAMAGLLQQSVSARNSRVPGFGNLPVLGSMFRSVRYETGETELIVLVTAELVEPLSIAKDRPVPGSLHLPPDDWQLYANGALEADSDARIAPIDADWLHEMGLDRLKGPGAWVTNSQPKVRLRAPVRPETTDNPEAAQ